jgi:hypothetical protein
MVSDNGRKSLTACKVGRHRRSDDFPVRQWLKLGLASAGMGAALLGFSLVGPDAATARADTGTESSASADSSNARTSKSSAQSAASSDDPGGTAGDSELKDADGEAEDANTEGSESNEADDEEEGDADEDVVDDSAGVDLDTDEESDDAADAAALGDAATATTDIGSARSNSSAVDAVSAPTRFPIPPPVSPPYVSEQSAHQQRVAELLADWTEKNQEWVNSLQISDARKERLQASFLSMRRTFFNQAPTVAPIQITGVITGSITGSVGAVDPDGDRMLYIVSKLPTTGSVKINPDGSFTYTPDDDFNGVDTFYVRAVDIGFHVNLLQPLRPIGSGLATSLINQGAVTFEFHIKEADRDKWDQVKLDALQRAANRLVSYFRVLHPVNITYDVSTFSNDSELLAAAASNYTSYDPGVWLTRVQHKLLTGEEAPGKGDDGLLYINFGKKWSFGDSVAGDENDFTMTIMHELLHSFGWVFGGDNPPYLNNRRYWSVYANLVVDEEGRTVWNDDLSWNTEFNPNLLRQNGGIFFGGANAVKANGGKPVPLFSLSTGWFGSTGSHLDDLTPSTANKLMDAIAPAGRSIRVLSPIEFGILMDMGYTVVPQTIVTL